MESIQDQPVVLWPWLRCSNCSNFEAWILQIILSVSRLFWLFLDGWDVWGSQKNGGGKFFGWRCLAESEVYMSCVTTAELCWEKIWSCRTAYSLSECLSEALRFFPRPWHVRYPWRHHQKFCHFFVVFGGFGKRRKWFGNLRSSHHNQSSNQAANQTTKQRNEQRNEQQLSFRLPKAVKKWKVQKIQHEIWHLNKEFDWRCWDFLNTLLMRWKEFLTLLFPGLWQFTSGSVLRCIWIPFQITFRYCWWKKSCTTWDV